MGNPVRFNKGSIALRHDRTIVSHSTGMGKFFHRVPIDYPGSPVLLRNPVDYPSHWSISSAYRRFTICAQDYAKLDFFRF